ncbi:hypothetical protein MMC07_003451 [Pseudocyphellaria aurata]|nr:hypothetical protein [Pseudocyphellaria aurata]
MSSYRPTRYDFRDWDSWRPENDFSFRNNDDAPRFPQDSDVGRSRRSRNHSARERNQRHDRNNYNPSNSRQKRELWYRNHRGRGGRVATAERPLLRARQGDVTEKMFGLADDMTGTQRFLSANDMSDSEEEDMQESVSDMDESGGVSLNKSGPDKALDSAPGDNIEPPTKRRALGLSKSAADNIPRWSNPDPYTSLPPIDDTQRRKKDVVKIIRKARVVSEKHIVSQGEVAANDDFISFGFEEESSSTDGDALSRWSSRRKAEHGEHGVPGAPSGPKRLDHLNVVRDQDIRSAPGSQGVFLSAESMGPPPGLDSLTNAAPGVARSDLDLVQDPALGNRKRTHDDVIKGAQRPPRNQKKEHLPSAQGSLTEAWVPNPDTDSTPWLTHGSNCQSESAGFRLHREICDFYEFVRPQAHEQSVRENLLSRVQIFVRDRLRCEVFSFGSFAAGLYLPNADMDLVVLSDQNRSSGEKVCCQSPKKMFNFATLLRTSRMAKDGSVEVIIHAKVPLIKFVDRITSIRVDLSFENQTGLIANSTFLAWKNQFPAMPILVTVIKQFLMMRGLNEVVNGGLGGFSVTCLVTSLLQNMPRVQTEELIPEDHLGEMLIEFLDFYGNQLDIARTGIKMDPPGYFNKIEAAQKWPWTVYQANKSDRLAIMDPNKPENDISGGSRNITLIFDCFSRAHEEILDAMNAPGRRSLLDWPLGGNYETFEFLRNRLRIIYNEHWPVSVSVKTKDLSRRDASAPDVPLSTKSHKALKRQQRKAKVTATNSLLPVGSMNTNYDLDAMKGNAESNEKARARSLRQLYPNMKNVPDRITKKERTTLVHRHKSAQRIQAKMDSLPEVTEERRKEVARNLTGFSNSDPIFID